MMELDDCAICGATSPVLEATLVLWVATESYEAVNRCLDRDTCRRRVADKGERWPVWDPTVQRETSGKRDPNQPLTDWAAETRRARATEAPGMSDPRPPKVDRHGRVSFAEPIPMPAIPAVKPPIDPELDW